MYVRPCQALHAAKFRRDLQIDTDIFTSLMQEEHVRNYERKHALICSSAEPVDKSSAHERPVGCRCRHPDVCDQCDDAAYYHCRSSPENVRARDDDKVGITQSDDHDSSLNTVRCMFYVQEKGFETYQK